MTESPTALTALLLQQLSALVRELDRSQVRELVAGRSRLAVVATDTTAPAPAAATPAPGPSTAPGHAVTSDTAAARGPGGRLDAEAVGPVLMSMASREEARAYVSGLGNGKELRALAAALGVRVLTKDRNAELVRKIVDGTLGVRLSSRAIVNGAGA